MEINNPFLCTFKNKDEKCMRSIHKNVDTSDVILNVFSDACSLWIRSCVNIISTHISLYVMSDNMMTKDDVHAVLKTGFSSSVQLYFLP